MNKLKKEKLYAISSSGKEFEFTLPLSNKVQIGDKENEVELKFDQTYGLYLKWNGKKYPAEIIKSKQNKYEILFNNISYSFTVETPFSLQRMKSLKTQFRRTGNVAIKAPMPGKIVEVLCQKGSSVSCGETVLILEAMKMENEILSPINGIIKSVTTKKDDTVMKDDILIEIEEKKG